MRSVAEAQKCVLEQVRPLPPVTARLDAPPLGLVLAEDIISDVDMPPFTKALMDGYAIRASSLSGGMSELTVVEEITAGKWPVCGIGPGEAAQIMTGAPLPEGADAVVMRERSQTLEGNRVRLEDAAIRPGSNVMPRGREMRRGDVVLKCGTRIRPQEAGLLATVGRTAFQVHPAPRVAILSTGDEVVEPTATPRPGQIRNGNGSMLVAQVCRAGGVPRYLGIAGDRVEALRPRIVEGLGDDVLILSGGVSAGKLDLVPQVLADLGMRALFHKVSMKPGKPVLFGVRSRQTGDDPPHLVFGLPGNPVSAMVCFELFVRPALRALMALPPGPPFVQASLAEDFAYRTDRPTYHPARLWSTEGRWLVQPVPWFGSPDLRAVAAANAFVVFPEGDHRHGAGETFPVLCVEDRE
jgi:molybdopterin molybdotransferase